MCGTESKQKQAKVGKRQQVCAVGLMDRRDSWTISGHPRNPFPPFQKQGNISQTKLVLLWCFNMV